jgi:acetolactate synthase-1/2/3 large subunit
MSKKPSVNNQVSNKVTDVIAHILAINGVRSVFGVSGGAALHILHSIKNRPEIRLVTTHHEQAAAMAAESTSRVSNSLGVAVTTSGPGATNLITGIAGAFYDSVPAIFITGQVSTNRLSGNTGVRQLGFQETPIVDMVQKITKYAVQVTDPNMVISELEKCIQLAISGRQGPTLFDIPDDVQRMQISLPMGLPSVPVKEITGPAYDRPSEEIYSQLKELIVNAKRPVFVLGWGVHLSKREIEIREALDSMRWPTLLTWGASDFLEEDCEYRVGTFGTHGNRDANIIIQNSDLIISIGSRLDTKSTGSPASSFAKEAKLIMIDTDKKEIDKFDDLNRRVNLAINLNLRSESFLEILESMKNTAAPIQHKWNDYVQSVKLRLKRQFLNQDENFVDPYNFIKMLSGLAPTESDLFVDTGCAIAWASQSWQFKKNQRLFHDFNNTAMGWALPASIASLLKEESRNTYAIIGDGSFMMSLQELATIKSLNKPIKIFLLNNSGYSMIKQTQDQWFDSNYFASDLGSDMFFPNYSEIALAFGYNYKRLSNDRNLSEEIEEVLLNGNSVLCEVLISPHSRVIPQVKFGSPIEGMEPAISEDFFKSLMFESN